MHALALPAAAERIAIDRAAIDRHGSERFAHDRRDSDRGEAANARGAEARIAGRVEILWPGREDARTAARRYEEASARTGWRHASDEARWARAETRSVRAPFSTGFVAQYVAQQQPANAAHVEDWRGARAAYARADSLDGARGSALSIVI